MTRLPPAHLGARLALLLPVLLAAGCGSDGENTPAVDLLITDVRVVDARTETVLDGRTVAVSHGEIAAVWGPDEVPVEMVAGTLLDGRGRYLIPGLWDAHVHFRSDGGLVEENRSLLAMYPAFGVTTVRDAGGNLTPELLAWRDSIRAGTLVGPDIFTSGPKLDGPQPSWEGSIALESPDGVPAALDSLQALGVDYVKLYDGSMSPEVFLAAIREAEDRGLKVTGHMPLGVDFLDAVEAGLDGTEHLYYAYKESALNAPGITARVREGDLGFWSALYAAESAPGSDRESEVFATMREHGTVVVPTLHIGAVLATVEVEDHSDDPLLSRIPDAIRDTYARRVESARRASDEARARNRALRADLADFYGRMHAAGVTTMAGSDAGPFNSYVYPGESLHAELEALVEVGLTPAEALLAATVNPATFLGVDAEVSRIAPGFRADLVLLEENPLENISATRTVSTVILRGETVLDRDDIQSLLQPEN